MVMKNCLRLAALVALSVFLAGPAGLPAQTAAPSAQKPQTKPTRRAAPKPAPLKKAKPAAPAAPVKPGAGSKLDEEDDAPSVPTHAPPKKGDTLKKPK